MDWFLNLEKCYFMQNISTNNNFSISPLFEFQLQLSWNYLLSRLNIYIYKRNVITIIVNNKQINGHRKHFFF